MILSKLRALTSAVLVTAMFFSMALSATADAIPNSGKANFDFQDKAFFTVNMTSEEKVYLNLDISYQKNIANLYDAEFDCFYNFKGTHDTFNHKGLLLLPADSGNSVYEIDEEGELIPIDSQYVKEYVTGYTGRKIDGYLIETKTLGNYAIVVGENQ